MINRIGVIDIPISRLHMELTNICNFSCEFCPDSKMKRQRGMMPLETAKAILEEIGNTKIVKTVLFHIMGEPTLYPYLVDVVEYANSKGIDTCLTTNGSRLDEKLLGELVQAGIGRIIISLQTPDEKTFALRGANGIQFGEYTEKILAVTQKFFGETGGTKLTISFLSSPLRRLIIPIFPEVSIADTSADLKKYLSVWAERIVRNSSIENRYGDVLKQIQKIWTFKENTIQITDRINLHTRVMGDWSIHFDKKNVNAYMGFCPGIRENFGILWNGDYTFCCTDFDGKTSVCNFNDTSIYSYLNKDVVQKIVKGFNRFRVLHSYCKQCMGDRNFLNAVVKQIGTIAYFKWIRRN